MYSIILASYKESKNLNLLIDKIFALLKKNIEIIIVDDFSDDGTLEILKKKKKKYKKKINYLIRYKDRGLGKSIYEGLLLSKRKNIVLMDCDFNHNPKDILRLIEKFEKNNLDFIVGSRFKIVKFRSLKLRFILSYFYCLILSKFLGYNYSDSLSGFFIIKKKVINKISLKKVFFGYGDYFFRLIYFLSKKKLKVDEIQIKYGSRIHGYSKTNFIKVFLKYTYEAIKLKIYDQKN